MQPADILITGGPVITCNDSWDLFPDGAIAIRDDSIVAVGPAAEITSAWQAPEVHDVSGKITIPGLVNAHTHAPMTLLRGLADDLRLDVWLMGYMMPVEREFVSPEFCRLGTSLACAEMIRSGTTSFADMYYFEEDVARATAAAGMRAVCSQTVMKFPTPDAASYDESLALARSFIEGWKDHALIVPSIAPHAPYTCTPEILRACAALAVEHDIPLHIHLSETALEVTNSFNENGKAVIPWVEEQRLFDAKVLAAHCVHIDEGEMRTLLNFNAGVAHNPSSNLKLASGIAPISEMRRLGLNVGIGTDGPASNNDLDMFEETRLAAFLAKGASGDPTSIPAREALGMATRFGANALHIGDLTGSIESGKRADLTIVDLQTSHNWPGFYRDPDSLYSRIVYAAKATDVSDVMVNGTWLLRAKELQTLNEADLMSEAGEFAKRIDSFLIEREQSVLRKLVALGTMEQQESFEVQVKAHIDHPDVVIDKINSDNFQIVRFAHYAEFDTYFFFDEEEENLLRIREDEFIGDSGEVADVRYRLTLIGAASEREFEGSVVLSRSRFIAPSNHTPRFYREYFNPRRKLEIEKDRLRWLVVFKGIEFFINIDRLIDPDIGTYVEVKSRTWSLHDAATKASLAADVMEILGATPESLIADDYVDLVEKN